MSRTRCSSICWIAARSAAERFRRAAEEARDLQGEYVEAFEERWAEFVGTDHAVAVTNGTVAIQLALNALGLEPGDEVIVPSLTFGSTATAIVHQGGVPAFADIDRERDDIVARLFLDLVDRVHVPEVFPAVPQRDQARVVDDVELAARVDEGLGWEDDRHGVSPSRSALR